MLTVLEITLPVFGLVFCGFFGARGKLLPERAVEGLNAFVFWFALPAMLFRVVALRPLSELFEPRFIGAYVSASLVLFVGAWLFARSGGFDPARRDAPHATAYALTATHGNVGYLGLALVGELGREWLPVAALTLVCDIFVVITLAIALLESQTQSRGQGAARLARTVISGLLRSPLVMSIVAGLLFALSGLPMPSTFENFSRLLSNAAGPCALFAIGAALGGQRPSLDRPVMVLGAAKLLVHPLLMAVTMLWVFKVEPGAAAIGILSATLPSASNTFIIAQRYGLDYRPISSVILLGTFAGLVTVSLAIWMLGLR